ncbi:hypothetical protein ACHAO4_008769 [Trichoderma viride]
MATAFHSFPCLPFEIRSQIWALAAYPRLVHIRTKPKPGRFEGHHWADSGRYFASMIPQAELMHFNFDEDMICLQHEILYALGPHAADIQRLRFMVPTGKEFEDWAEGFSRFTNKRFKQFTALREVDLAEQWEDRKGWLVQNMDDIDEELWSSSNDPFIELWSEQEHDDWFWNYPQAASDIKVFNKDVIGKSYDKSQDVLDNLKVLRAIGTLDSQLDMVAVYYRKGLDGIVSLSEVDGLLCS